MVIKRFLTRFRTVKRETGVPHALHKDISIGQNSWNPRKVLLEDFEVIRRLGHGGMGDVYLVKSRSTGNLFSVKSCAVHYANYWALAITTKPMPHWVSFRRPKHG